MSDKKKSPARTRYIAILLSLMLIVIVTLTFTSITAVQSQDPTATADAMAGMTVSETGSVETGTLKITLDAVGSMMPVQNETIVFSASAPVTEINVQVGDTVHADDVLARIETTDQDARVRSAELQVQQAQTALENLQSPPTQIEIDLAEAQVTLAQAQMYSASNSGTDDNSEAIAQLQAELARNQLWQAQINRDIRVQQQEARSGELTWVEQQQMDQSVNSAEDSVTIADMNAADAANPTTSSSSILSAQSSLNNAQNSLDTLLAGATADEIRQAQIQVEQAQLSLQTAQEALDSYVLVAPFDGIVAAQNLIVGVRPPQSGAMTILNTQAYTIDLSIAESDVVNMRLGQAVSLDLQAFPDAVVTGTITQIDTDATMSGQLVTYTAQVTVNDLGGAPVRPGMSATATITLQQVDNVLLVPNRFISTDTTTGATTVYVESSPGVYSAVPVTIGQRSTDQSQILSGLEAGQTIVILTRPTPTPTTSGGFSLFGGGGGAGLEAGGPPAGAGAFPGGSTSGRTGSSSGSTGGGFAPPGG